ncbi:MAG: DUF4349 domain-containing protein [Gemmatales bacterium]|nr:DUF4349 domain-containing protein [Gemmatales bacterium]MDW7995281.1 DUF4349 domain-containing protein [Gemmatales bacterium]
MASEDAPGASLEEPPSGRSEPSTGRENPAAGAQSSVAPKKLPQTKIIYEATVQLGVENLDLFAEQLDALVGKYQGYIARTEFTGASYARRQGSWRVRIPSDSLQLFLRDLSQLGELNKFSLQSQDVTEEYYDLESRLNVAKAEEKRLLELLDTVAGKLEDVLNLERELNRVRTDIERLTGQLRRVTNLIEYSTVTLTAVQRNLYVPESTPAFSTRWYRTLRKSWDNLVLLGEDTLILVAWLLPWSPVWIPASVLAWFVLRRRRRRTAQANATWADRLSDVQPIRTEAS